MCWYDTANEEDRTKTMSTFVKEQLRFPKKKNLVKAREKYFNFKSICNL